MCYRDLRSINQAISQTSFEDSIEKIKKDLDVAFEKHAEKTQDLTMLMSMIKGIINN
jgi:hypothetical protein